MFTNRLLSIILKKNLAVVVACGRMSSSGVPTTHEAIQPLTWLLGKWQSTQVHGQYPTLDDFKYHEELHFSHVGQPNIQYEAYSWKMDQKTPLHRELGFLRINPGTNKVAFMIAQNLGVCEMEEGEVTGQTLKLQSHTLGRMSFGKPPAVKKVARVFELSGGELEQVVLMETEKTPMTEHLRAKYKKVA